MTQHPTRLIWDRDRSACLCSAGNPLVIAAVFVNGDGVDEYWLIEDNLADLNEVGEVRFQTAKPSTNDNAWRPGVPSPPHEHLGRLPVEWRDRIWGSALRCGRPCVDGSGCRQRVAEPGASCSVHGHEHPQRKAGPV